MAADFRLEVAHIISAKARPDLAFELSNVRTLDFKCHILETQAERSHENDPGRLAWRELLKTETPLLLERNNDAFRATLADGGDKLALVDHDPGRLLARTKSGTLRLAEDSRGLHFEIAVPATQLGNDVLALAERGDLGGMSFAFRARPDGEHWSGNRRELRSVDLAEVSVVLAHPAYAGTSIDVRSRPAEAPDAGLRRALLRWRA